MTETNQYLRACALTDVPERGTFAVELNGIPLVIARSDGEVFALDEFCTHEDVSLADGEIYDHTVECWLHGSCFDLRTGKPTGPPASKPLATYPVRIDGDEVFVALPSSE
ncbi:MAG TPA: non-heme iron oxygenase ferredoxin subunit [Streptosporangiaceae bacterium]|nr:non-heme iron oxygenase ferredoxin subunit [Streptosporangiaceae bacterium]